VNLTRALGRRNPSTASTEVTNPAAVTGGTGHAPLPAGLADQPDIAGQRYRRSGSARAGRLVRGSLLHVASIVIAVGIFAAPILYLAVQSLRPYQSFLADASGIPRNITFANYSAAWTQGNFGRELINSLLQAGIPDVITVVLGVFLAFPIARNYFKRSGAWYAFFLFSGFLPGSLIPLFIEARFLHLYNSTPGYIFLVSLQGAGFFFFVGYLKSIPREREEAAALDGCGYIRFILTIILPEMKPALAAFAVFGFVSQWNNLILPLIMLADPSQWPATRGLYGFFGQYSDNWPLIAAGTVIVAAPVIVVFVLLQRHLVEGVAGGAVGTAPPARRGK
jgi:raffinose/stachyose/melibiose transport system permease protein